MKYPESGSRQTGKLAKLEKLEEEKLSDKNRQNLTSIIKKPENSINNHVNLLESKFDTFFVQFNGGLLLAAPRPKDEENASLK